ncbi:MAG: sigma-70 family RNA polymerase sigma factor, partial [Armatimonadota bacterium]|nr:sigma-70 family RNA polymerase sigma factor [Armatimonadota bacterium]
MTDDGQLLRQYVRQGSQAAFAALVARHLNFVYSVCQREAGDAALAEDVTQVVFLILAKKAPTLRPEPSLTGWLFQTARFAARNARRRAARRKEWEARALAQTPTAGTDDAALWDQVGPALNDALAALGAKDREAVLLRFADGLSFPELGTALGTSEDAARMRLTRAVERLRQFFAKQGVTLSVAGLTVLLADRAVQAAPAACVASVTRIAESISPGAINAGLVSPQINSHLQGVLKAMTISKLKLAATLGVGAILAGSLPFVTLAQTRKSPVLAVPHRKIA